VVIWKEVEKSIDPLDLNFVKSCADQAAATKRDEHTKFLVKNKSFFETSLGRLIEVLKSEMINASKRGSTEIFCRFRNYGFFFENRKVIEAFPSIEAKDHLENLFRDWCGKSNLQIKRPLNLELSHGEFYVSWAHHAVQ
jgi:hypothetical protein